jgi:cyanate permease
VAHGGTAVLYIQEASDVVSFLKEFGTGWKGLVVLWSVLAAWVLHGYLPERYKTKIEYKKFLKEHEEKMKKLERANQTRKRKEPDQ